MPLKPIIGKPNRRRFDRYLVCVPIYMAHHTRQVVYVECILWILAELQPSINERSGQSAGDMCGGTPLVSFFQFRTFFDTYADFFSSRRRAISIRELYLMEVFDDTTPKLNKRKLVVSV